VGSTAIISLAVALVTMLALFEYFALGEAIAIARIVLDGNLRSDPGLCAMAWGVRAAYSLPGA